MSLYSSLKKQGIFNVFVEKIKTHNLIYDFGEVLLNGTGKTSLELTRLGEINKATNKMNKQYKWLIDKPLEAQNRNLSIESLPVWTMWLQGETMAPLIVKKTILSIKSNYKNVVVITKENFKNYVSIPQEIVHKWEQGLISNTHFSDIVRTELLIEFGGTWIDATVFISRRSKWLDSKIDNRPLFFFQNLRPGSMGNAIFLSSWFITAVPNEPSLVRVRDLLYSYWHTNNQLSDYFLFHIFWHLVLKAHPEVLEEVPKVPNSLPLELMYELNKPLSPKQIKEIFDEFPMQKLTYKNLLNVPNAAYKKIMEGSF